MRSRNRKYFEAYGEVYFITSTVVGFINIFDYGQTRKIFVDCLRFCQERGDFRILAWVLMPNHFHLVIKRAEHKSISEAIGGLKRFTAREIGRLVSGGSRQERIPDDSGSMLQIIERARQAARYEPGKGTAFWKPRFDSYVILSEDVLRQKIQYIHSNPVRKGFVAEASRWRYSSASIYEGKSGIDLKVDTEWSCLGYGQ